MIKRLPVIAHIEGFGDIVEAHDDFHTELRQLKSNGARLISPRDEAYARLQTRGKKDIGRSRGTRTSASFEYAKGKSPILNLNSRLTTPIIAKLAVQANARGSYFHTETTREYEKSLARIEKERDWEPKYRTATVLPSRERFTMSDKEHWDVYQTVLKDQAKPFFEFNGPITVYPVNTSDVDAQDGTLLMHLWFRSLDDRSGFDGYSGDLGVLLYGGDWVRGVRAKGAKSPAKPAARKV